MLGEVLLVVLVVVAVPKASPVAPIPPEVEDDLLANFSLSNPAYTNLTGNMIYVPVAISPMATYSTSESLVWY